MPNPTITESSSNVTPLHGRMSAAEYEAERTRLRGLYGDNDVEALAKRDQALAILFARSGWTQEELATKEGKSRQWIVVRVRFGSFLNFATAVAKTEILPKNLTEGRFRSLWEQTEKSHKDEIRFRDVLKLMQSGKILAERRPLIGEQIVEKFADGKWHTTTEMAEALDLDEEHVKDTLAQMIRLRGTYGCKAERKSPGSKSFRIFKKNREIPATELLEKLTPILNGLRAEGKRSHAAASPATVALLAGQLQKLLDEWTQ
jgi:hypothetical protein